MGLLKKIIGGAEVAAGAAMTAFAPGGQGAGIGLMTKGGGDLATSGSPKKAGATYEGTQRQVGQLASGPPTSAASLDQARSQDKTRIKSIYNYP